MQQRKFWPLLFLVAALLLALAGQVTAQQAGVEFEHISLEQGLSQSTIYCLLQDRQGFIWAGTQDGLNRYDGYNFKVYKHNSHDPNSLPDNFITSIAEDTSGILWIGTADNGIARFDRVNQQFTNYKHIANDESSICSDHISTLYFDHQGTLWIGSSTGLSRFNAQTNKFINYQKLDDSSVETGQNGVAGIFQDRTGSYWIGAARGLFKFEPEQQRFTRVQPRGDAGAKALLNAQIVTIMADHSGTIWIGAINGLFSYQRETDSFTSHDITQVWQNTGLNIKVYAIAEDEQGNLWMGSSNGLSFFDRKTRQFTSYRHDANNPVGLSNNVVHSLLIDRSRVVWIGTLDNGLEKYDPRKRRFGKFSNQPGQPPALNSSSITAFLEDSTGALWVGNTEGLNRFEAETGWQNIAFRDEKPTVTNKGEKSSLPVDHAVVRVLFQDRRGLIWIGYPGGLRWYLPEQREFVAVPPQLLEKFVQSAMYSIFEDRRGFIWIGAIGAGLIRYNPANNEVVQYPRNFQQNGLDSDRIVSIVEDAEDNLWLGTLGSGLYKFDRAQNRFFSFKNQILTSQNSTIDRINALCLDQHGTLWLATPQGLGHVNLTQKTLTIYSENDGLANGNIYGLLIDRDGYLWMSTNRGISRFDPATNKFKNFDVSDGLQSNEFNTGAFYQSRRGELFFGGIKGFNRFFPAEITDSGFLPPIVITSFKAKDALANLASSRDLLPNPAQLELRYQYNFLSIEFAALNFSQPERNEYAYRLEGVDENWIYCGRSHQANYTNLAPGDYTFHVKGSNNDGLWNEQEAIVKLRIIPPFWLTWWAYLIYLTLLVGSLTTLHNYRLRLVERRNQLLEVKVAERTAEVNRQNEELAEKNQALLAKNQQLLVSNQRADRIFSALAEALPGTVLDEKYRLDEKIGAGGFGAVYRATHLHIKREVAVKVFRPAQGNDSAEALERFQQEAVSACRVNHPNAVAVLDSGISAEGIAYLVMELLQGHTLTSELRRFGTLSIERCAQIVLPVCSVLEKAHTAGLVHRDIKPENIFLHYGLEGEVIKVVDFGIAKFIDDSVGEIKHLTGSNGLIGTPIYIAPERFALKPYDGRSDIYSLGIMIYEMLSGRVPFLACEGFAGVMMAHMSQAPPPLKKFQPDIPDRLAQLVNWTLAKDPADRPTAQELAEHLSDITGVNSSMTKIKTTGNLENIEEIDTIVISPNSLAGNIANKKRATDEIRNSHQITIIDTEETAKE